MFTFSILIIKSISNESNEPEIATSSNKLESDIKIIDEDILKQNYAEDKFIEKSLIAESPFFLSINADSKLSMNIQKDSLEAYTEFLYPGTEKKLQEFVSNAKIIFPSTNKIKARLNGEDLSIIENYPHPLKLIIRSSPPSISIRLYTPLN